MAGQAVRATVVLCRADGTVLGALPPMPLEVPWRSSSREVVAAARERQGLDVTVLRLLDPGSAEHPAAYLCEVGAVDVGVLDEVPDDLSATLGDEPLRQRWARPGGPGELLSWADAALAEQGACRTGTPTQVRAWNLSGIWYLPTSVGGAWLKAVPPFFAHEGAMLELVARAGGPVPRLLGHEPGRVLLADVAGRDLYDADGPTMVRAVEALVALQAALATRVDDMLATGAFDWRPAAFDPLAADVVARTDIAPDDARVLDDLVGTLAERHAKIAACGIPDTLVHGDFHPGNLRGDGADMVILDWGDSGVGHPLMDQAAALERAPEDGRDRVRTAWAQQWRRHVPGCEPERAARLLEPVAALRQAVIYRLFLDRIEPSEQHFHASDPALWLARAAHAVRAG